MSTPKDWARQYAWAIAATVRFEDLGSARPFEDMQGAIDAASPFGATEVLLGEQTEQGEVDWPGHGRRRIPALLSFGAFRFGDDQPPPAATIVSWGSARVSSGLDARRYVVAIGDDDLFVTGVVTLAPTPSGEVTPVPGQSRLALGVADDGGQALVVACGEPGAIEALTTRLWVRETARRAHDGLPRWDGPERIVPFDHKGHRGRVAMLIAALARSHGLSDHEAAVWLFTLTKGIPAATVMALPDQVIAPAEWTGLADHDGWRLYVTAPVLPGH